MNLPKLITKTALQLCYEFCNDSKICNAETLREARPFITVLIAKKLEKIRQQHHLDNEDMLNVGSSIYTLAVAFWMLGGNDTVNVIKNTQPDLLKDKLVAKICEAFENHFEQTMKQILDKSNHNRQLKKSNLN